MGAFQQTSIRAGSSLRDSSMTLFRELDLLTSADRSCVRNTAIAFRVKARVLLFSLVASTGVAASEHSVPPPVKELPRHAVLGAGVTVAEGGVKVTSVRAASAAERSGLRVGDVITRVSA